MPPPPPTTEGYIPLPLPSLPKPCTTYYKLTSPLPFTPSHPPLIISHGGPGTGHEYLTTLTTTHAIPTILYDQVGCARSTSLAEYRGDESVWNLDTFLDELENLIGFFGLRGIGFSLFGHSWGGMLVAAFAADPGRARGLRRVVVASGVVSSGLAVEGYWLQIGGMGVGDRGVLGRGVEEGGFEGEEYRAAYGRWRDGRFCLERPVPEELRESFGNVVADGTGHFSMLGPSILKVGGALKDFDLTDELHKISVPTFVYNGEFDTSHDVATVPFFERIPKVRWRTYAGASHMCHLEEATKDKILNDIGTFLLEDASGTATK